MKKWNRLFLALLFVGPHSLAMDDEDIPPPPMPEYMKKHQIEMETQDSSLGGPEIQTASSEDPVNGNRETASTPADSFGDQSAESIRHEFLNAGDELVDTPIDESPAEEMVEGSMEESSEQEIAEAPEVYEDPVVQAPIEEVSEVEVAEPEFEQAGIEPSADDKARNNFQADVGNATPEDNATETQGVSTEEVLASVEENLEASEQEAETTLDRGRTPTGKKVFKAGMYQFSKKCTMYAEPGSLSSSAGSVPVGRKLWLDPHNDSWHKAYKKSGTVYIPSNCLQ